MWLALAILAVCAVVVGSLALWQASDRRQDNVAWMVLAKLAERESNLFDPSQVADLPEPARRYFSYAIAPGTPIQTAFEISMKGQLGLGTKDAPNYQPMEARQMLAPPYGLVWVVKAGALNGSDGIVTEGSWTRFWLFRILPIVRAGGADHHRSAFGRVVSEAAFWSPASLLPGEHVQWQLVDDDTSRAIVRFGELEQYVDITVDADGAVAQVEILRWSNENAEKEFRLQPFGGFPSEYRSFGRYRLPTRVEGGNHFGTPNYFPFFIAEDVSIVPLK